MCRRGLGRGMNRVLFKHTRQHALPQFHSFASLVVACMFALIALLFLTRGTPYRYVSAEKEANIAFFVQVSNTSVSNLPRLLHAIWHERNFYVVHFDLKIAPRRREHVLRLFKGNNPVQHRNVIVMDSEAISYAGITMLLNTINGLSTLLRASTEWDFFINISGSDYPLVAPHTLRKLLGVGPVRDSQLNFLQAQLADNSAEWFFNRRISQMHIDTALWERAEPALAFNSNPNSSALDWALVKVNASHPMSRDQVSFVKTEGWVILHRSFCDYAVNSPAARRLLLSFATARAADELFFGTLLTNSEQFQNTIAWDGLRYILWGMDGKRWSRPAYLDRIAHPDFLRNLIVDSGAFFARKFAMPDSELMNYIDTHLIGDAKRVNEVNQTAMRKYHARVRERLLCIAQKPTETTSCVPASSISR